MRKLKQLFRTSFLYLSSAVLIASAPMAVFADDSDACAGTGHWSDRWKTDPTTNQCVKLYDKDGTFVGPSYMAPQPSPAPTPATSPSPSPSVDPSTTGATGLDTTVNNSGNNNDTAANTTTDGTATTDTTNNTTVNNGVQSTAESGNAKVKGNQSNGGANSGDTDTNATVVNSVHSTVDGGSGVATFTYDIDGDVTGDITLSGTGNNTSATNTTNLNSNTNVTNNTKLNNDVDLNSTSGDAAVEGNESNGSATSGNANAVANILNLINTVIAANQSFVGTINIKGNLNGDILLSPEFIPQLIAANGGSVTSATNLTLGVNVNDNTDIVNNIKLSAASGAATVSGNESSGNATTGNTQTNLTILNLTGHQVTAANSLLVFVNVLGTWVGMIVDAPGATAAALGSGVIDNTTNVTSNANLTNNAQITNNINLAAQSGNALVDGNESNGNATSGNATASANVANISTSTFNLSGWFGVLFINVFGKWIGSFGIDTAAGTVAPLTGDAVAQQPVVTGAPDISFGYRPTPHTSTALFTTGGNTTSSDDGAYAAAVLASAKSAGRDTTIGQVAGDSTVVPVASPRQDPFSIVMMVGGFGVVGISGILWAARRIRDYRMAMAEL